MGRKEHRKGRRVEYQVRDMFRELGLKCERVPCSGNSKAVKGDLLLEGFRVEVKARKRGFSFLYRSLRGNDLLVVKADRMEPLLIIPLSRLKKVLERFSHEG